MIILALDLSTHTGWTHDGPAGRAPFMGTKHLPSIDGNDADGYDYGTCAAAFVRWLHEMIDVVQPTLIGYEAPMPQQAGRMQRSREWIVRMQYGLPWDVEGICSDRGITCHERNIRAVKKFWTGDANASKPAMIQRCRQLGWDPKDDNQADSAALWSLLKSTEDKGFQYATGPLFDTAAQQLLAGVR